MCWSAMPWHPDGAPQVARLTASETAFTIPPPMGPGAVFASYFGLGVDHILQGLDHLLFVFALLLLIRDARRLIGAVTAFTVAHSLSLGAASLGWIVVPAPPVEAIVALSIMVLAAELAQPPGQGLRLTERYPWSVAFAFGLLHGLGFARALLDLGLPEGDVPAGPCVVQSGGRGRPVDLHRRDPRCRRRAVAGAGWPADPAAGQPPPAVFGLCDRERSLPIG
jgi:hydrogenase/urease accessory protein HupE